MRALTLALLAFLVAAPSLSAQITTRASVDSGGLEGNETSVFPDMSGNAEVVGFHSEADNLVAGDTNLYTDTFVHMLGTGITERVSVSSTGVQGNLTSTYVRLSGGGDFVTFSSYSTNLVADDTNGFQDVFWRDRTAGITTRVSVDSDGNEGNAASSFSDISDDGRYVVFSSDASNLVDIDTNGVMDVFRHDTVTGDTIRISVNSSSVEGNDDSFYAAISEDGRYVAFQSDATNLVTTDTNGFRDIFVRDVLAGTTELVSVNTAGDQGNGYSQIPSISGAGGRVAFASTASNLVAGDTNTDMDIFVRDLTAGTTIRVSVSSSGDEGDYPSQRPDLSRNGEVVAFQSNATNFDPDDTNGLNDVYAHSLVTGETERISVDSAGIGANSTSEWPSLSAQGTHVAFQSLASNLVAGDTNGVRDTFVRQGLALYFLLDPSPGDPVEFVTYSSLDRPGDLSLVLLSCTGTDGFALGGVTVPLTYDACTTLGLRLAFALRAPFDATGTATTPTVLFPNLPRGTVLYAAAITMGVNGVQHVTDPITIVSR